ncbi:MAG: hypothetical protein LBG72_09870 [Spirochaetaceae bacterium]|jgi:tetratricopeptide (TPR) repeat protein|nr:hypothetical protein [Spirochaetaceae bacterium]
MVFARLIAVLLFVFCAFPAASMGSKEKQETKTDLAAADILIAEKNYKEALKLLVKTASEKKDHFDSAQKRMRSILMLTQSYDTLAKVLMDTAEQNPEDLDKILAISKKLREIEAAARSDNTRNVVNQIFISARFSRYGRDLNRIMIEARMLLDKGEINAALLKYQSGFSLYAEEFREAKVGDEIENTVRQNLQTLTSGTETLARTAAALRNSASQASRLEDGIASKNGLLAASRLAADAMNALITIKNQAEVIKNYFETEGEALTEAGIGRNAVSRLFVISYLITGREFQSVREGMLGAYDAYWNLVYPILEEKYIAALLDTQDNIWQELSAGNWNAALQTAQSGAEIAAGFEALAQKYISFTAGDDSAHISIFDSAVPAAKAEIYANSRALAKAVNYENGAAQAGASYSAFTSRQTFSDSVIEVKEGRLPIADALKIETQNRAELTEMAGILDDGLKGVQADITAIGNIGAGVDITNGKTALVNARSIMQGLSGQILKDEETSVIRYFTLVAQKLGVETAALEKDKARADAFLAGEKKKNESGDVYTARYPAQALALFSGFSGKLKTALEEAENAGAALNNEPERIPRGKNFTALQKELDSLINRLRALSEDSGIKSAEAKARVTEAEALKREGDSRLVLAREALKARNFDKAREETGKTAELYNSSLEIQESDAIHKIWDEQLVPLNAEIARIEYEMVIGEVRAMVTKGRALYFDGEYENAEEVLMRASNRWAVVSTTPEPEVAYWLSLARGALSLQSGRTVPQTSPLYKTMSQLLNSAQKNYDDGIALIGAGKRGEGEQKLHAAKGQINEIRVLFPINRDAGILDLRIDQILEKENFERAFSLRLQTAIAEAKRGSREAYADMQNLAEIKPDYPGIQRALYQAEIDIGLRVPPQDNSAVTRADALVRRAKGLMGTPPRYEDALALINEALRINPNSTDAMALKDRLQLATARQNVTVIDRSTEQNYIRAVSELQRGNTIIALSIVQRLLQNPANQNSVKINDLRRRIEAMM